MPRVTPLASNSRMTGNDSIFASAALQSAPPTSIPSYRPLLPSTMTTPAPDRYVSNVCRISSRGMVWKSRLIQGYRLAPESHIGSM